MRVPVSKLLLLGSIALVVMPLGINKPGMPTTLKADEPAYYMMAQSLARDRDLRFEVEDIRRLVDEFPILPVNNVILMTDDAWSTVYFGKPYIYPLVAAPMAALFGANGMVSLNMAMMALMIWLGFCYLRRYNDEIAAAAFAVGFFVLSSAFAYTYWMHPEVFNMLSGALCLFFAYHRFDDDGGERRPAGRLGRRLAMPSAEPWLAAASGGALAFGVYNKPMLLALALPALYAFLRRGGVRCALAWVAGFALALGLICGVSVALTGHPSAYLGVWRAGPPIRSQDAMPELPVGETAQDVGRSRNSFEWLIRIPPVTWSMMAENGYYFLFGRHTGLFPYAPFALIALVLFVVHARRSALRWLTLVALASIALYFLSFIAFNWHGGGGFIGNRYFVMAYPAFLFLVTRLRPAWLTGAGYAAGALFLGAILTTPYGAPVHRPTLQAHARGPAFSWLPLEFSLRRQIPGYWGDLETDVWFWGRKDVFEPHGTEFLIHGATTVEVWMMARQPLGEVAFQIRNPAARNRVELALGGDRQTLEFDRVATTQVVLRPRRPFKVRREGEIDNHIYRLLVTTSSIQILELEFEPEDGVQRPPKYFPAGARIAYLGSPAELETDVYAIDWEVSPPAQAVGAGRTFRLPLRVRNTSQGRWRDTGAARVQISYHWLDEAGGTVVREGLRTTLPHAVEPGATAELALEVLAPPQAGRYLLELDAIRERVSWFSRERPESVLRLPVEVAEAATRAEGAPAPPDEAPGAAGAPAH